MENLKNTLQKIKDFFALKKEKTPFLIIVLGGIGILLIMLSELFPGNKNAEIKTEEPGFYEFFEDESELETKLSEAISKIKGAGKTEVIITFETSKEYKYAKNSSENISFDESETEDEIVIIESDDGEKPIVIRTEEAKIRGVLVICEGGKNPLVREKIIEAVCALFNIPSNKVSVAEMA